MNFEIQMCPIRKDNCKWVSAYLSLLSRSSRIMHTSMASTNVRPFLHIGYYSLNVGYFSLNEFWDSDVSDPQV